jgi:DNA invertase Pin-like site-specific DNA recombinase
MAPNGVSRRTGQPDAARCAIYTRKSSEDGLEQTFNSLDAQREACLAYITSQRHEGWRALPTVYDDGGFSGGTPHDSPHKYAVSLHRTQSPGEQRLLVEQSGKRQHQRL